MQWNISGLGRAVVVLCLLAGPALAGPLTSDPNAMLGWSGSQLFNNVGKITATVEFAVYAPGDFSTSAALGNPVDPSVGTDWVYAYEIFAGTTPVLTLTVGTDAGTIPLSYIGSNRIGDDPSTPELGTPPDSSFFNSSIDLLSVANARWTNSTGDLWENNHSDILFFTAPYGPHWKVSTISGGGTLAKTENLPSPVIPEPSSVALALIASASLLTSKRLRRRLTSLR